jgi:hypothetical protein
LKKSRGKKFIHPSLRKVEATADAPSKKLTYVPRAQEDIVLTDAEKRRRAAANPTAAPAQAGATPEPTPEDRSLTADEPLRGPVVGTGGAPAPTVKSSEESAPLTDRETAPPMPINSADTVLKLRRKTNGAETENSGAGTRPPG